MSVINYDYLHDPFVFNADRNTWMSGGGTHTWNASFEWTFTDPLYINWLAGRSTGNATRQGTADYNIINGTTVVIPLDYCAYVTLDPNTDGAVLTVSVCAGASLPQGDNIYVVAIHRDIGLSPLNPLLLRWGNTVPVGQSYNQATGMPTIGFAADYSGSTWTVNHNLNSLDCLFLAKDNNSPRKQIWPQEVEFTNVNTITVTFSSSVTGRAVCMKAI